MSAAVDATTAPNAHAPGITVVRPDDLHPSAIGQFLALSRRAIKGSARQGPMLIPSIMFPLFFVAINSSSFQKSLPLLRANGYPKLNSFLTFTLAATVVQGVMFGSVQGATDLATDIEGGFFERMIAAPAYRATIVIARLAGGVMLGVVQALLFTALLVAFGARIAGGLPAAAVLVLSTTLLGLAFGGLLAAIAVRSGSAEVVQSCFPIVFILLFMSAAFFPRETMRGWFKQVARFNPLTHIVEPLRELIINQWTAESALKAIAVPSVMSVVTVSLALAALRSRLKAR